MPLRGSRYDGHDFIAEALQRGAQGFLCQRQPNCSLPPSVAAIRVHDAFSALNDLGRWAVRKLRAPVIAIAGSNGKTTTKELIAHMLAPRFRVHATVGNHNTEIGLPLTVLNAPDETEMLILEMGTAALGDVRRLCQLAPPTIGVLTSVSEEHVVTLGSLERIIEAETEVLEALPGWGLAVVNGDNPDVLAVARRKAPCRLVTFGFAPHNDFVAEELVISREGTRFFLKPSPLAPLPCEGEGFREEIRVPLLGRPAALAALAATAVAHYLGLPFSEIRQRLRDAHGAWGRLQLISLPQTEITILHDAYNANPASMREAIVCAAGVRHPDEELIFVLGDMLELGAISEHAHRQIGRSLADRRVRPDRLITVGEQARLIGEEAAQVGIPVQHFATPDAVARSMRLTNQKRYFILLKGSRGMHLERVLDGLLSLANGIFS